MEIELSKLEKILEKIFSQLKEKNIQKIELDADFYWSVLSEDLYNPYNEPTEHSIGQLSEDYEMLVEFCNENNLTIKNLTKVSSLLRFIGEKE